MVDFSKHLNRRDMSGATCPTCASGPLQPHPEFTTVVVCMAATPCGYQSPRYVAGPAPTLQADADQAEHYQEAAADARSLAAETVNGQQTVSSCTHKAHDEEAKGDPTIGCEPRAPRTLTPLAARVSVSLGLTRNLGNFEFARMDVKLEDYCDPTPEARAARFSELKSEAKTMLQSLTARVDASLSGRR